jgi:hypothetical protein
MSLVGVKVVARYRDGRLVKGLTYDFQAGRARLHVFPTTRSSEATSVDVADLKAVFFVRDLVGNPRHHERRAFPEGSAGALPGARVAVTFVDGEVLFGTVEAGSWSATGLVLVPADPESNNLRVYVVSSAVQGVRPLPVEAPARRAVPVRRPSALSKPRPRWLPAPVLSWLSRPAMG